MGPRRRGFSLLEMVVSIGLVAFVIVTLIGLVPVGVRSLAHADQLQTAALYGDAVLEESIYDVTSNGSAALGSTTGVAHLNNVDYTVQQTTTRVDNGDPSTPPLLVQIDILITWYGLPQGMPISSRVYLDQ